MFAQPTCKQGHLRYERIASQGKVKPPLSSLPFRLARLPCKRGGEMALGRGGGATGAAGAACLTPVPNEGVLSRRTIAARGDPPGTLLL